MDTLREPGTPDLSTALNALLSDPELMSRISGIVNGASNTTGSQDSVATQASVDTPPPPGNATTPSLGGLLSNPDIMEKLPEVMATIAPMLKGNGDKKDTPTFNADRSRSGDRRIALLCALKPYLSPRRCEAIDYIIKLDRIGSLLHNII